MMTPIDTALMTRMPDDFQPRSEAERIAGKRLAKSRQKRLMRLTAKVAAVFRRPALSRRIQAS